MANTAEYIYRILDKYTGPIAKITRGTRKFNVAIKRAQKNSQRFSQSLDRVGQKSTAIGQRMSMRMTLPIIGLGIAAGKTAIDIQSGFIGVQKTVNATAAELATMKEGFKEMSKVTPVSIGELFKLGEAAGQLGIKNKNILSFTKTMAELGMTTNISSEEGAIQLAQFAKITQMSQGDFDRLGSTIVYLGNNLETTERDIVDMAMQLASAGRVVDMTQAQIIALAGAAKSVGLESASGGTAFSRVMFKMGDAADMGGAKLRFFAKVAGTTSAEFKKKIKTNSAEALILFTEGIGRMKKEGKNLTKVFAALEMENVRIKKALLGAAMSGDSFRKSLLMANKAWEENNALAEEAALRSGSWGSKLIIIWNRIKLISNELGKILVPIFIKLVDKIVPFLEKFNNLSRASKKYIIIIGGLLAVVGPLLIGFGMLAMAVSALLPALIAMGAIIMGISLPVVLIAVGIGALIYALIGAYRNSAAFRQSLVNLADAFKPLLDGAMKVVHWIGDKLGISFGSSSEDMKTWGDEFAVVINVVAALLKGLFTMIAAAGELYFAAFSGDVGGSIAAIKKGLGFGDGGTKDAGKEAAANKEKGRGQSHKLDVSGGIDIATDGLSRVKRKAIELNQGQNVPAYMLAQ